MNTDTPRPEHVTLTHEERLSLSDALDHEVEANCWRNDCDAGIWESVERILAARREADAETIRGLRERYERLRADVEALAGATTTATLDGREVQLPIIWTSDLRATIARGGAR